MTRAPVAVAITGGIGAGKSEALRAFARHGAATVSSDEIVHHLLRRPEVRDAVVERMGNGIVDPDTDEIDLAWTQAAEFVGRMLDDGSRAAAG